MFPYNNDDSDVPQRLPGFDFDGTNEVHSGLAFMSDQSDADYWYWEHNQPHGGDLGPYYWGCRVDNIPPGQEVEVWIAVQFGGFNGIWLEERRATLFNHQTVYTRNSYVMNHGMMYFGCGIKVVDRVNPCDADYRLRGKLDANTRW